MMIFKKGEFQERKNPFFTKKAFQIYDNLVAKHSKLDMEVIICQRNDNHTLVRAWSNLVEQPKYKVAKERLKASRKIYFSPQ